MRDGAGDAGRRHSHFPADGPAAGRRRRRRCRRRSRSCASGRRSVGFYRYLYNTVGADYVWWLRRTDAGRRLAALLRDPLVSIHVLYADGEPAGFFELDARGWPDVNLSYFGLMPHAVGTGVGYAFLRQAVDMVWRSARAGMTVNTCTADHPRALPTYLRAGFRTMRQVRELWNVPLRLGMSIPDRLRA